MSKQLTIKHVSYPLKQPFAIAHGTRNVADVVEVTLTDASYKGIGECVPYARYGESIDSVIDQLHSIQSDIEKGASRDDLLDLLPAGAARHAIDTTLWEVELLEKETTIGQLSGLGDPPKLDTAFTLSINTPEIMGEEARLSKFSILKLKLSGDGLDSDRLKQVRIARLDSRLIVDANESWTPDILDTMISTCVHYSVELIEQPLPEGNDSFLKEINHPIPICADESCHTTNDLEKLVGLYDVVNLKLDKTGGLTHAIKLYKQAIDLNFEIMVGCMVGSSISLKNAYPLAQHAKWIDLDAIHLLA